MSAEKLSIIPTFELTRTCSYDVPAWGTLFHTFAQTIQVEQGDAHLISTVLEPLADSLRLEQMDPYR